MRRFEFIQGNTAKFWEIEHYDEIVVTRQGKIGGKEPPEKEKSFIDDMAAEVEFDKMIHAKRRQGWVEVEQASEPLPDFEERAVELRPLDGSKVQKFAGKAMKYLLWRMVEVQMFDRHRAAPDMSRWDYRAYRKAGLDAQPEPGSADYGKWLELKIELSTRDRGPKMNDHMVGAFKYREGTHWIVTPEECAFIAQEAANRKLKRKKDTADHTKWLKAWCSFHDRVASAGYEVVPV